MNEKDDAWPGSPVWKHALKVYPKVEPIYTVPLFLTVSCEKTFVHSTNRNNIKLFVFIFIMI